MMLSKPLTEWSRKLKASPELTPGGQTFSEINIDDFWKQIDELRGLGMTCPLAFMNTDEGMAFIVRVGAWECDIGLRVVRPPENFLTVMRERLKYE